MKFSSLDSPSGHIVCGFLLLILGALFYKFQIPIANETMTVGIAAITISMRGLSGGTVVPMPSAPDKRTTVSTASTSDATPPTPQP
jgi:hypothetical protein